MPDYKPTIGLEVHVELKTATKMFCNSKNDPDEKRPNVNICPICLAHPGTLPVPNKKAIEHVIRVGLAVGGTIADYTEMDRKNYFYPDIPKGYQLSQYKYPLVSGGELAGVALTRIHIEEDTARSIHDDKTGESLVDFNRAGVPLMELVTEPVITSAKQAADFAKELQLLLSPLYLNVSEANLEKGEMRVEANISINPPDGRAGMGTKVEIKNLNSFRAVERATEFEIKRQTELLERGEKVVQETRGWDEDKGITFSQRKKETSHDYRYFPDPDIPKMWISKIEEFQNLKDTLPELASAKRERLTSSFGLKAEDAETFVADAEMSALFESAAQMLNKEEVKLLANYLTSDLMGLVKNEAVKVWPTAEAMSELIKMIGGGELSSRGGKDVLVKLVSEGGGAREWAEKLNLFQKSDEGELLKIVEQVIAENQTQFADLKAGNEKVLQFLVGQGMKLSKGSANPGVLAELFKKKI